MKKRVVIVHGWDYNPNMNWYPWLKKELEILGYEVIVPEMPDTSVPAIEKWVGFLKKSIINPDKETYFIGHSIGCQTIMRYLDKLNGKKVGGCIFVAGWFGLNNLEDKEVESIARPWIETPINFKILNKVCEKFSVFISDNDPYGQVRNNSKTFKKKLDAEVIIENGKGHYTEADGIKEIGEVLNKLIEMNNK